MDLPLQNTVVMPEASASGPVSPVSRPDSHTPFLVLVLLVSLVISTVAVFLFWQNQQLRSEITKLQTSPTPSPSSAAISPEQELEPSPASTSSASPTPVAATNSAVFEVN